MVTFDSEEIKKLITKSEKLLKASLGVLALTACIEVTLAWLVSDIDNHTAVTLALFIAQAVGLAAVIILFVLSKVFLRRVKFAVLSILADAMEKQGKMLYPDGKIALVATYAGDKLTLSRENTPDEINFDLFGIKKVPKIYSSFGTYLVEYIEGYFAEHMAEGCQSVTICDKIGGRVDVIEIVNCGKLCKKTDNNYFLKRGLIK